MTTAGCDFINETQVVDLPRFTCVMQISRLWKFGADQELFIQSENLLTLTVWLTYRTLIGSRKLKPRWEFLCPVHVSMWLAGSFALVNLGTNGAKPVQPPGLVRRKEKQSMLCPGSSHKSGKCPSKFIATVGKLCLEPARRTQRAQLQSDSCIIKSIKGHIHNILTDLIGRNRIKLTLKTLLWLWINNFKCLSGPKWFQLLTRFVSK